MARKQLKNGLVRDEYLIRGNSDYVYDQYYEREARAVLRALSLSTSDMGRKLKRMKIILVWDMNDNKKG